MSKRFTWGHININVRDLDASVDFYRKLGFERLIAGIPYLNLNSVTPSIIPTEAAMAMGMREATPGRACIMQLDDGFPKLDLTELAVDEQRDPLKNTDLGLVRICLVSEDLQAAYQDLKNQGIRFLSPPVECHERLADVAVCVDPDGTLIEMLQVHLDRWGPYLS
jgi:catechol 2,3-dioxygenase-like lactoylglutathione lyase family enzyme